MSIKYTYQILLLFIVWFFDAAAYGHYRPPGHPFPEELSIPGIKPANTFEAFFSAGAPHRRNITLISSPAYLEPDHLPVIPNRPLQVATVLQSNMVIQQNKPFAVWGSAAAGDSIRISASWSNRSVTVVADDKGTWKGVIKVPKAVPGKDDPHQISVIGLRDTVRFQNILIGEVWICAGQSNMDMYMEEVEGWYGGITDYRTEIANAVYPAIRVFTGKVNFSVKKQPDIQGKWEICSPQTAGRFSGVAYFFGRKLHTQLRVPVGLVVIAAAGASAQALVDEDVLKGDTLLKKLYWDNAFISSQAEADSLDFFTKVTRPALLYNGMIHPLKNLSISGFTFYQGESNYTEGSNYTRLCSMLIQNWRLDFNQGDLPFYFTQIAPYADNAYKCDQIMPLFWEAQKDLLRIRNTGMAFSSDVGELKEIHPKNKKPVGERLARLALRRNYHLKSIADRGPEFSTFKISKEGIVRVLYVSKTLGDGLATSDGKDPKHFLLSGSDGIFYPATARIVGKEIWLQAKEVARPIAVRYGFYNEAITNLENSAGLPAVPFRTDHWPVCLQSDER